MSSIIASSFDFLRTRSPLENFSAAQTDEKSGTLDAWRLFQNELFNYRRHSECGLTPSVSGQFWAIRFCQAGKQMLTGRQSCT